MNSCKWAHLAADGKNPHLNEHYTLDDLGKFENLQAFEDSFQGADDDHVPYQYKRQEIVLEKPKADL